MMELSIMIPAMLHITSSRPWRATMCPTSVSAAPRAETSISALSGVARLADDGPRRLGGALGVDVGAHHGGAGAGQHLGGGAADAAPGSGDQGHAAGQIERVSHAPGGFHRRTLGGDRAGHQYASVVIQAGLRR